MSTIPTTGQSSTTRTPQTQPWQRRIDEADWDAITAEVNQFGCALTPQLLSVPESARIAGLYDQDELFRSTVNIVRYRFGSRWFSCSTTQLERGVHHRALARCHAAPQRDIPPRHRGISN